MTNENNGRLSFEATIDDKDFKKKVDEMGKEVVGLGKTVGESSALLDKSIAQLTTHLGNLKKQLANTRGVEGIRQINIEIEKTQKEITRLSNIGKKGFDDLGNAIPKVSNETKKAGEEVDKLGKKIKDQPSQVNNLTKAFGGLGNMFKTLMASFGLFAGIQSIFSLFRGAVNDVVAFDKSMTNLSAIAGVSRSSLKGLESDIRKVASESINTATAVADMAMELIKLGTTPQGVRELLKPVNDLSIAFQASADATAVLLKGTLNAFQASESEAQRYADVMAMSANKTALGFQEIADSFTYISATANVAGYSIEETAAFMGVLVDNNVQASSAGRVLSSVFGRLAKGGKELEGELEKIRNSQDKLAQASKIFGAEGARLGVILANNKDRLAELTKEFENSSGSLAKLTSQQLESISAQYEITKSAWQELILTIENGKGVISTFVKEWLEGLTMILNAISKISKTYGELKSERMMSFSSGATNLIDKQALEIIRQREKTYKEQGKEYTAEKKHLDEVALKNKMIAEQRETASSRLLEIEKELKAIEAKPDSRNYNKTIALQKEQENLQGKLVGLKEYEKKVNEEIVKEDDDKVKTLGEINNKTKERLALLDKIDKAERSINDSVLSERENAIQKTLEKYRELNKEAVKLGMNTERIQELQSKELEVVSYKSDTDKLKESLLEQRKLYEEFEATKLRIGEEGAKTLYSNLLDTSKNYYELLGSELDKIDTNNMDAKTRNRYAMLTSILVDFDAKRSEIERNYLSTVLEETKTNEQKLTDMRLSYAKKRAEIEANFSGSEATNRLDVLESNMKREYKDFFDGLINNSESLNSAYGVVAGATRSQIISQMESLKRLLAESTTITDVQKETIKKTLVELNDMMRTSTNDLESNTGRFSVIKSIEAEVTAVTSQIEVLRKQAEKLKVNGVIPDEALANVTEINAKILVLENRLRTLGSDKVGAVANMFGEVANEVGAINDLIGNQDSQVQKVLQTISKLVSVADMLQKSFKDVSGSLTDISKSAGEAGSSMSNSLSQAGGYLAIFGAITGIFEGMFDAMTRASVQRQEAEMERLRKELDYQRRTNERLLKEASRDSLGIEGKKREMDILNNSIKQTDDSLMDLYKKLNDPNRILGSFGVWQDNTGGVIGYPTMEAFGFSYKNWEQAYKKANSEQKKFMDSIDTRNKSLQEIMEMYEKGVFISPGGSMSISKETKNYLEEMRKLGEILEDNKDKLQDFQNELNAMVTGTSIEELSDAIADIFARGGDAAYEFGQSFEEIMKRAVVNSFKNEYILKEMQGLFDEMAKFGDKGYSQAELDALREMADETAKRLQIQWDALNGALDLDFGETAEQTMKDSVKRITEQQADRLVGITMGIQTIMAQNQGVNKNALETLITSQNLLNSSYQTLISIEANTRRSADGIDSINGKLDTIISNNDNSYTKSLGL